MSHLKSGIFFALSLLVAHMTLAADYKDRMGARVGVGIMGYGGYADNPANTAARGINANPLANFDEYLASGIGFPIQAEFTYNPTHALELLVGLKVTPSVVIWHRDTVPFIVGPVLGFRYYFNMDEPIKAYLSPQFGFALNSFWIGEVKCDFGLQWDIDDLIAVYLQTGAGVTGFITQNASIGNGIQFAPSIASGVHFHF